MKLRSFLVLVEFSVILKITLEGLESLVPSDLSIEQAITSLVGTAYNNHSYKSSANIVGIHA